MAKEIFLKQDRIGDIKIIIFGILQDYKKG